MDTRQKFVVIESNTVRSSESRQRPKRDLLLVLTIVLTGVAIAVGVLFVGTSKSLEAAAPASDITAKVDAARDNEPRVPTFHERYPSTAAEASDPPPTF